MLLQSLYGFGGGRVDGEMTCMGDYEIKPPIYKEFYSGKRVYILKVG